ncbi:signal recognition particle protein Srp19 [Thermococcus sp.]|uniref:signal recognition particle protein Srp19 n=1 Tax=Thermococcus sp. TaxID=35749 RepID=UPI002626A8B7|nr:signal recognition particle protein Srp19 [Thermococcus sp.]
MKKFVIWPNELDSRLSRRYGRAVSRGISVNGPRLSEIVEAAESLGMKILESEPTKLNPRLAGLEEEYQTRGMLRVESRHPKTKSLKMIAQKIKEIRDTRAKAKKPKSKRKKR